MLYKTSGYIFCFCFVCLFVCLFVLFCLFVCFVLFLFVCLFTPIFVTFVCTCVPLVYGDESSVAWVLGEKRPCKEGCIA